MDSEGRARQYAAVGNPNRLRIIDLLNLVGDLTVQEIGEVTDIPGNLLAHHLDVLEGAGLITRRTSQGDHRRRYVTLTAAASPLSFVSQQELGRVLFVCSHNSARSQYAAARWAERTGDLAQSAGLQPARRVNPTAVRVAAERGLDLTGRIPKGYDDVGFVPDLVISVCDQAREAELPSAAMYQHWSIPDPVPSGKVSEFRSAFREIDDRVERLVEQVDKGV